VLGSIAVQLNETQFGGTRLILLLHIHALTYTRCPRLKAS
jgi:hypothetical protein